MIEFSPSETLRYKILTNWVTVRFWSKGTGTSTALNMIAQKKTSGTFRWRRAWCERVVCRGCWELVPHLFTPHFSAAWRCPETRGKRVNVTGCLRRKLFHLQIVWIYNVLCHHVQWFHNAGGFSYPEWPCMWHVPVVLHAPCNELSKCRLRLLCVLKFI